MKRVIAIFVVICSFIGIAALPASATSKSRVLSALQSLSDDFSSIQKAAEAESFTRLSSACDDLGYDAGALSDMTRPKSMSSSAWLHLMTAMEFYISASDDCVYGCDNYDVDSLQSAITSMKIGKKEIDKARKSL